MSRAKDLITSNPRISLVGGLVESSIDPHSRHSGRDQVSRQETLESQKTTLVSGRFSSPARATRPSSRNRFPYRGPSCTGPVPELIFVASPGTRAGAATTTGRMQQNCEVMWSLVQRLSVSGKCAGRRPPCRPARLDDPTSVLPSWRSTSAASVRTCCFTTPATAPLPHALHAIEAGRIPLGGAVVATTATSS